MVSSGLQRLGHEGEQTSTVQDQVSELVLAWSCTVATVAGCFDHTGRIVKACSLALVQMDGGFARYLLDKCPNVFHPVGASARCVVPAFVAEEYQTFTQLSLEVRSEKYSSTSEGPLASTAQNVGDWLLGQGWVPDASKARPGSRPYSTVRAKPYTPPSGTEVRQAWSELLRSLLPEAAEPAAIALFRENRIQAASAPSAATAMDSPISGRDPSGGGAVGIDKAAAFECPKVRMHSYGRGSNGG